MKIRTKDKVIINKGKDIGKSGKVERVIKKSGKVVVSGINIYKKHGKPTKKNPKGGIIDITMPMAVENVTLVCPHCSKPTRIGYKVTKDNKVRICKKCGDQI
ncbi:MAG: 50S ribosomal protein L24 [Candidatus Berkelbacteria bacterium]|nr:50S ribosomal protein L24 [Candidatus Berkelbacteria bacterium]